MKAAGDSLLVVKRSHATYWWPRFGSGSSYRWTVHFGPLFLGRFR